MDLLLTDLPTQLLTNRVVHLGAEFKSINFFKYHPYILLPSHHSIFSNCSFSKLHHFSSKHQRKCDMLGSLDGIEKKGRNTRKLEKRVWYKYNEEILRRCKLQQIKNDFYHLVGNKSYFSFDLWIIGVKEEKK